MPRAFHHAIGILAAVLATGSAAHADTIDAAVQPFFVGGGILVGALFAVFAYLLIRRGLGTRWLARESANWPVTDGKILAASVRTEMRGLGATERYEVYIPQARYSYTVAGAPFEGTIIRVGVDQFGYRSEDLAQAQLTPYQIGAIVPVRTDPADPAIAVLEAAEYGGARNIFGGAICVALSAGAVVFAVWASNLATR